MIHGQIHPALQHGLDILASLAARGIQVSLREDGRPAATPRRLLDEDVLTTLRNHRDLVIAALGYELARDAARQAGGE